MDDAEIIGAANQIHPRVQSLQARSGVSAFARQAGQSFAKGSVQSFNKGSTEDLTSARMPQQLLGSRQGALNHRAGNLHDALFLCALDDRPNVQVWPPLPGPDVILTFSRNARRIQPG